MNIESFKREVSLHVFAFTDLGRQLKRKIDQEPFQVPLNAKPLADYVKRAFDRHEEEHPQLLVFIGATGIAVRSIASYLGDKRKDPPVIVIDDQGQVVISLMSGHFGKANELTYWMSKKLQGLGYEAKPIVTTATDNRGFEGVERILTAYRVDPWINREAYKKLNSCIANGQSIHWYVDPQLRDEHIPPLKYPHLVNYTSVEKLKKAKGTKVALVMSHAKMWENYQAEDFYVLYSKSLVLGTGCRKNTPSSHYEKMLLRAFKKWDLPLQSIAAIASIDLKKEEKAIHDMAKALDVAMYFFSADDIKPYAEGFQGSKFVEIVTGVKAIAGPCAYKLTDDLWTQKVMKENACTFSVGRMIL